MKSSIYRARFGAFALALMLGAGSALAADAGGTKLQGKIGDDLSTGKWHVQVLSVEKSAAYDSQFLSDKTTTQPESAAEELVVVTCTVTNSAGVAQAPMLSSVHPHNTALTDAKGKSYPPLSFDKEGGHTDEGVTLAPGAATTFAALFSVPKGIAPAKLTFSLQTAYEDYPDGGLDVHVLLGN